MCVVGHYTLKIKESAICFTAMGALNYLYHPSLYPSIRSGDVTAITLNSANAAYHCWVFVK